VATVGAPAATPPAPPGPLAWRTALQVTLASLVAMLGGMALSPQRWFWAVIAVYVVFLNARSRGDTVHKGFHRIAGTLAGLFGGLLISTAVANNEIVICVVMLAAVFGAYYLYSVSYSAAIFCVTVLLGMVYGSLNAALGPLLVLRFEETAIGVLAAGLAASFVWPIPTRHQVRLSGLAVLRSLRDVVQASLAAMDPDADPAPIEAVRRLDRQIGDLRLSLIPLNAGRCLWAAPGRKATDRAARLHRASANSGGVGARRRLRGPRRAASPGRECRGPDRRDALRNAASSRVSRPRRRGAGRGCAAAARPGARDVGGAIGGQCDRWVCRRLGLCVPCRAEMPARDRFKAKARIGFPEVVAINVDGAIGAGPPFLDGIGVKTPHLLRRSQRRDAAPAGQIDRAANEPFDRQGGCEIGVLPAGRSGQAGHGRGGGVVEWRVKEWAHTVAFRAAVQSMVAAGLDNPSPSARNLIVCDITSSSVPEVYSCPMRSFGRYDLEVNG
jgi:hypothetical protein